MVNAVPGNLFSVGKLSVINEKTVGNFYLGFAENY